MAPAAVSAGGLSYVYCVAHRRGRPRLDRAPAGVPGTSRLRAVAIDGDLWLILADATGPDHDARAIERGLHDLQWVAARGAAHEAVVEHVGRQATVLPMKLFTLFRSEERALRHIRAMRSKIERTIERVRGRDEWGVRVRQATRRLPSLPAMGGRRSAPSSGTEFLLEKRAERAAARDARREGVRVADELYATLERLADGGMRRAPTEAAGTRLLLDAAFLVSRPRAAQFKGAARRAASRLADVGCELELTGPWPPYHFIEARP